jgi:flagellar biosynthesis protein FlhA
MGLFSPRASQPNAPLLTPESLAGMLRDLNHLATTFAVDGRPLPLITPPSLRVGVRRLIEPVLPSLPVVSLAELPAAITLSSVATWEMPHGA